VGSPIASLEDEVWCSLPVARPAAALGAVVLLARSAGVDERLTRLDPNPLRLLPHLLPYPQTRERERARFELASDIAGSVPVFELSADSATPPQVLATVLLGGI
jgi:hypothetical protein